MFDTLRQDLRYGARSLRRSPGFTAIAALTLALGVGANAAVFAVLDQLLLRTPPGVAHPETLKRVHDTYESAMTRERHERSAFSYAELEAMRDDLPAGAGAAGYAALSAMVGDASAAHDVRATYVVGDYFGMLGVKPLRGRFFTAGEYGREIGTRLVVISARFWENELGRADDVIGRRLSIDAQQMEIIGVAPEEFTGVASDAAELWVPYNAIGEAKLGGAFTNPNDLRLNVVVRGTSVGQLGTIEHRIAHAVRTFSSTRNTLSLAAISEVIDPQRGATALSTLARLEGGAGAILVIACANIINLLLVRAANRDREITIRLALGSSRARLAALLLSECLLISMLAATAAGGAAMWVATGLRDTLVPSTHWRSAPHLTIVVATLAIAVIAALLAGSVPVLRTNAIDLAARLRMTHRAADPGGVGLRGLMLAVQAALSMVLLAMAGLFVQSLWRAENVWVPRGADDIVVASVPVAVGMDQPNVLADRVEALRTTIARIPQVQRVALSSVTPIGTVMGTRLFLPDRDSVPSVPGQMTTTSGVSAEFFDVMSTAIIAGRGFTTLDRRDAEPVTVVSATMARLFWPGESAIGKCLIIQKRTEPCRRVVGIAQDVRSMKILEPPTPRYYIPLEQAPRFFTPRAILIRAHPGQRTAARALMKQLVAGPLGGGLDWTVRDYTDLLDPELRPWRMSAAIFAALAVLAVLVAAVGTYGTISYVVTQRTHEIGVRRALGADGFAIARVISKGTIPPLVLGVVTGIALAVGFGRLIRAGLFNVSPIDAPSLVAGATIILLAGLLAILAPLRLAVRVDPKTILSAE